MRFRYYLYDCLCRCKTLVITMLVLDFEQLWRALEDDKIAKPRVAVPFRTSTTNTMVVSLNIHPHSCKYFRR